MPHPPAWVVSDFGQLDFTQMITDERQLIHFVGSRMRLMAAFPLFVLAEGER